MKCEKVENKLLKCTKQSKNKLLTANKNFKINWQRICVFIHLLQVLVESNSDGLNP